MGKEFRGKGIEVALGPMMNLGRVPQVCGFSADVLSVVNEISREEGTGKVSAQILSWPEKLHMRPSLVCRAQAYKLLRNTMSISMLIREKRIVPKLINSLFLANKNMLG